MGIPTLRTSGRTGEVARPAGAAWEVLASGRPGPRWYLDAAPLVLRGGIDRLLGGAGRAWEPPGRPLLAAGDRAGFWRVLEAAAPEAGPPAGPPDGTYDGGGRLVLEAAVRAPGRVLLEAVVDPLGPQRARVGLQVIFEPRGVLGHAYLLADLPAREAVVELTHRRLLADLRRGPA